MSNASEYADSLAEQITEATEAGAPFGWRNDYTDEPVEADDLPEEGEDGARRDEDGNEIVPAGGYDWLRDALDIQYLVNSDRTYRSARILIAFGGPNAWIDTRTEQLEVSWWSAVEYRDLPRKFIEGLDEALEEMWEMGA